MQINAIKSCDMNFKGGGFTTEILENTISR